MSLEIQEKHSRLLERNTALRELLDRVQEEKTGYRHRLTAIVDNLLHPIVDRLEANGRLEDDDLALLQRRLSMITERPVDEVFDNMDKLTERERGICELIRKGLSSRHIAQELGLSPETVNKHRQSIRRKLQIDHRGINLASYLRST
jgi:DNA-binding NarL/FixJ family response regulator